MRYESIPVIPVKRDAMAVQAGQHGLSGSVRSGGGIMPKIASRHADISVHAHCPPAARGAASPTWALLALDGSHLDSTLLQAAAKRSVQLAERVDILLVNAPKAPTSLLWGLLVHLEHAGVYYRLASTEGDLGEQILIYLQRFIGINMVLLDGLVPMNEKIGMEIDNLRGKGYCLVPIIDPCNS